MHRIRRSLAAGVVAVVALFLLSSCGPGAGLATQTSSAAGLGLPDADAGMPDPGLDGGMPDPELDAGVPGGDGGVPCGPEVVAWDPSLSELEYQPPAPNIQLPGDEIFGWQWHASFGSPVSVVRIAPAIDEQQPYILGIDYYGVCTKASMNVFVQFDGPGPYSARVEFVDPTLPPLLFMLYAGAYTDFDAPQVGGECVNNARFQTYDVPNRDVYTVASTAPDGFLDGSREALTANGKAFTNVANRAALATAINAGWTAAGARVSVFMVGHGSASNQRATDADRLTDNNANVVWVTGQVQGHVTDTWFFACCTAASWNATPPGNNHVIKAWARQVATPADNPRPNAYGWDQKVCSWRSNWLRNGRLGVARNAIVYSING